MKKTFEIKLKSFDTADKLLGENENVWKNIPGIAISLEKYHKLKVTIETKSVDKKSGDTSNVSTAKKNLRLQLETQILKIAKSYTGIGANNGDQLMRSMLNMTKSELQKLREIDLSDTGIMVYNTAIPKAKELGIYIDASEIEKLKKLATDFKTMTNTPRLKESKDSVTTVNIEDIINEMDHLFSLIDDMIEPFEFINPDFYMAYTNARKLIGMSSRKRKKDDNKGAAK